MRRSTVIPCLIVAGLAMFMFVRLAPSVSAQARDCRKNCGEGEKPPMCCTPPPCAMWDELKEAKAYVNFYGKAARLSSSNFLVGMLNIPKVKSCSGGGPSPTPLEVSTDGKCTIGIYQGRTFIPQSPDDALKNNTACAELVKAEYAKAERAAAFCRANLAQKKPLTKAQTFRQSQRSYQAKVDSLEDSIYSWLMACSKVVDAKLQEDANQETELEKKLKALKDAKQKQLQDAAQKFMNWASRKLGFGK